MVPKSKSDGLQPSDDSIDDFINDMKLVFPTLKDAWGIYVPEVKYLATTPLVNYNDLSLTKYPNVHFVGDALSARGITVSGAQGTYVAENLLKQNKNEQERTKLTIAKSTMKQEGERNG